MAAEAEAAREARAKVYFEPVAFKRIEKEENFSLFSIKGHCCRRRTES